MEGNNRQVIYGSKVVNIKNELDDDMQAKAKE